MKDPSQSNDYILEKPVSIDRTFSIFFSEKDMRTVIAPALDLYDKNTKTESADDTKAQGGEELSKLLEGFKGKGEVKEVERPLHNLYLGSILYYSPENWAVWVNGKKLPSHFNSPTNVFYVKQISRTEATFTWKPQNFRDMGQKWGEKSEHHETLPKNVVVDVNAKTVTLTMRPNQTFIPTTLNTAPSVWRYGWPVNPAGSRCMKVAIVVIRCLASAKLTQRPAIIGLGLFDGAAHGGGQRWTGTEDAAYRTILEWINGAKLATGK